MEFQRVFGQSRVKQILASSLQRDRLAHAYLFHGQPGIGKDGMALSLAMGLHCTKDAQGGCGECPSCQKILRLEHPCFTLVLPVPSQPKKMKENKYNELIRDHALKRLHNPYQEINYSPEFSTLPLIGIDQIRALKKSVRFKLVEGQTRIILISHADRLTPTASNSLLKILEEPPRGTMLILTTSIPARLLQTIISRCQVIRFDPLPEKDVENALLSLTDISPEKATFFARVAGGSIQNGLSLYVNDFEAQRAQAISFLQAALDRNSLNRVDSIESLIQETDKQGMQKLLQILLIWLRDLMCLKLGDRGKIINFDRMDTLETFHKNWPKLDTGKAIKHVEQAIDFIEKNVYLTLIIHSLSVDLHKCQY
ncbi:ATP-binding protein [bacterium]